LISFSFIRLGEINFRLKPLIIIIITLFSISNIYLLLTTSYLTKGTMFSSVAEKTEAAKKIIKVSGNEKYNVISNVPQLNFGNNLDNFGYLIWWQGGSISRDKENIKYVVKEENGKVYFSKIV